MSSLSPYDSIPSAQAEFARYLLTTLLDFASTEALEFSFRQNLSLPLEMAVMTNYPEATDEEGQVDCEVDLALVSLRDLDFALLLQLRENEYQQEPGRDTTAEEILEKAESSLVAAALACLYRANDFNALQPLDHAWVRSRMFLGIVMLGSALVFYKIEVEYRLIDSVATYGWQGEWKRPGVRTTVEKFIPGSIKDGETERNEEWEYLRRGMRDLDCREEALRCLMRFKRIVQDSLKQYEDPNRDSESRKRKRSHSPDGLPTKRPPGPGSNG